MLKEGGYFGMIVSNKWLKAGYGLNLRKFLSQYWIEQFIDFGDLKVFDDATTYPCIIIVRNIKKPNSKIKACNVKTLNFDKLANYINENQYLVDQKSLTDNGWNFSDQKISKIISKTKMNTISLKNYVRNEVYNGIKTGLIEAYVISKEKRDELVKLDPINNEILKPMITGSDLKRYGIDFKGDYLIVTKIGVDISKYPLIFNHLLQYKEKLSNRSDKGEKWYELRTCNYYELFDKPKIIFGEIQVSPKFTLDNNKFYTNNKLFAIPIYDLQLLAILNSKMSWFLIQNYCNKVKNGYILNWKSFGNIPIPQQRLPELEKLSKNMLQLIERIISLNGKQTDEKATIKKEIAETDKKIDNLVYDLYGLTEEERKIVEESVAK
jgi:hypothetical protein